MIDWDISYIQELEDHYNEIFEEHLNLVYFTNNFENIYRLTIRDKFLLPDLFHDVMLYTFNGINARDKMMYSEKELEILEEVLEEERINQRKKRHDVIDKNLEAYYEFLQEELREFIKKYPFWENVFR